MFNIIKIAVLLVGAILIALIVRVVVASATRPSQPAAVNTQKVQVSAADLPQGLLREENLGWK